MNHFRFVRHGLASALGLMGVGVLASCVSGSVDAGNGTDPGLGGAQGIAGTGNHPTAGSGTVSSGGSQSSSAGSSSVAGVGGSTAQGGTTGQGGSGQAGSSTGGSVAQAGSGQGGSVAQAGSGQGGTHTGGTSGSGGSGISGSSSTAGSAGGTTGPQPPPAITGGQSGFATRYWDCCKPACSNNKVSCSGGTSTDGGNNQSACAGGNSFMCWNFEPFQDPSNKYISYAWAASHRGCGSCWEIQFTGKAGCSEGASCPGTANALVYNTVYVQVLNTGSIADDQFDLLIPGGGVGEFNACSNEWGTSDLGAQYGGFLTGCNGDVTCTRNKCSTVFAGKPDLLAGCNWFLDWYGASDNPQIVFKQVSCPSQLTSKSGMSG